MNNQNFLLQKSICICEQITSINMRPCHLCGKAEVQAIHDERKAKAEQRQAFLKRYAPEYNNEKLPF